MGQKSKLTPKLIEELAGYVAEGHTNTDACRLARIGQTTFYRWLQKVEDEHEPPTGLYAQLKEALKQAEAGFKQTHLDNIKRAASQPARKTHRKQVYKTGEDGVRKLVSEEVYIDEIPPPWTASAWLLERKWPEEFGPQGRKPLKPRR